MNNDLSSEVEDGKSDHFPQIVLLEFTSNFTHRNHRNQITFHTMSTFLHFSFFNYHETFYVKRKNKCPILLPYSLRWFEKPKYDKNNDS